MKKKPTSLRDKLIIIGLVFGLVATCYGVFTYLERYASCESVDKVVQKFEKAMEQMDIRQQKSMDLMDYKLLAYELKQVEEQIYQIEKNFGQSPSDPIKKADLERHKRRREEILIEQRVLKEKK